MHKSKCSSICFYLLTLLTVANFKLTTKRLLRWEKKPSRLRCHATTSHSKTTTTTKNSPIQDHMSMESDSHTTTGGCQLPPVVHVAQFRNHYLTNLLYNKYVQLNS